MAPAAEREGQDLDLGPTHTSHPRFLAIITDGNGRWARAHDVPVNEGHSAGADTVKARLRDAVSLGVEELTVYSFSTENWNRSDDEHRAEVELQKVTDQSVSELDDLLKHKEDDILEV